MLPQTRFHLLDLICLGPGLLASGSRHQESSAWSGEAAGPMSNALGPRAAQLLLNDGENCRGAGCGWATGRRSKTEDDFPGRK